MGYGTITADALKDSTVGTHKVSELQSVYEIVARVHNTTTDNVVEMAVDVVMNGEQYLYNTDTELAYYISAGGTGTILSFEADSSGEYIITYTDASTAVAVIAASASASSPQSGTATVANGDTIAHGVGAIPASVVLTPSSTEVIVAATALDETHITVGMRDLDGTLITTAQTVYWIAMPEDA